MKITPILLSIPPYISTTWDNITSLQARKEKEGFTLIIQLQNLTSVEIPDIDSTQMDEIFTAHAQFTESKCTPKISNPLQGPFSFNLPLKAEGPIGTLGASMEHNPEQANLAPLSPDVLKKITMITRAFGLEDATFLQKAEPHCNCVYCQIVRALQSNEEEPSTEKLEDVSEEDLKFRNWEIKETDDKLYIVTNPLDANEHYSVFLGTPLGCTCGSKSCEHIRAVLNS